MSIFDFFKHSKKEEASTMYKLANRYLVEDADDYWIPFGRPERNYKITDMNKKKEFRLSIVYDVFNASALPREESPYYDTKDNYYKVSVSVSSDDSEKNLAFFSSELYQKDFDIKEKIINIHDVDLALYNQLKEARQDTSNPQRQEEAYLVSTLLRAAHDNIWVAPLLQHKEKPENSAKLEQLKLDVNEVSKKVKEKTQDYKQKRQEKQEYRGVLEDLLPKQEKKKLPAEQIQQQKSQYVQSLMKENFVDGL